MNVGSCLVKHNIKTNGAVVVASTVPQVVPYTTTTYS